MRTHRTFAALQPWSWRKDALREFVSAERLVAVRFEPVTRGRQPSVVADLHFSDGERAIAIPLAFVDLAQLDVRELDPLVFPDGILGVVSDVRAREIVEFLLPELERRGIGGGFWREEVLRFGSAPAFDAARAGGYFGAAPLAASLPRIAAAVYGQRFAAGKHVLAYGPEAIELGAFLAGTATSCTIAGENPAARAYFGDFEPAAADAACDLAIGFGEAPATATVTIRTDAGATGGLRLGCAAPLPADVLISFGAEFADASGTFTVVDTRQPLRRTVPEIRGTPPIGESSGRIAIVLRPDGLTVPDADSAEAAALAGTLRAEGFTVDVVTSVDALENARPDLVHLFGIRPGGFARAVAEWAAAKRKPLAVHALFDAPANGGYWGVMASPYCFGYSGDDHSVSTYLEMLARRAVEVDGATALSPFAPPAVGLADSERVLALADLVLVNSERERAALEPLRSRRLTLIVPPLPTLPAPGTPIGALTGNDPFILVHAPIGPEANQLMLARAVADVAMPTVFAGAVADPAYAARLLEFLPASAAVVMDPHPDVLATLYATAAVAADAAWIARGQGNLMTAAGYGAAVVISRQRWIDLPDDARWTVDPADVSSIARGIGEAWDAAIRADENILAGARFARGRLALGGAAILAAYARIG